MVVDEDGLPKGVGNTNSPLDDGGRTQRLNAPVDDAVHIGTIPFTPGADPCSIELSVRGRPQTPACARSTTRRSSRPGIRREAP